MRRTAQGFGDDLALGSAERAASRRRQEDDEADEIERDRQTALPYEAIRQEAMARALGVAPVASNEAEERDEPAQPRPLLDLSSLIEPAKQSAPVRGAAKVKNKDKRNRPDRDPGFEQVSRGRLKEGHSPSTVVLPETVEDGLDQVWAQSSVDGDGKAVESGGDGGRNYDGSYEVRPTKGGSTQTFESDSSDVGWSEELVGIMHTHPNKAHEPYTLSGADFTSLLAEGQPFNLLRSEGMTFMVVRTREFDTLVATFEAEDKLDDLERKIFDCYENVFERTKGPHPERLEAAVLAVCKEFHLIYYKGEGRELTRVSPRPPKRGGDAA